MIHHAVIFVVFNRALTEYGAAANIPLMCVVSIVLTIIAAIVIHFISKAVMKLIDVIFGKKKCKTK